MNKLDDIEKRILEDSEKLQMSFDEEFWADAEVLLDGNESGTAHSSPIVEEPFKEDYWDEMSAILDNEDRRKRRVIWLRWAFDVAAVLLLLFTFIKPNEMTISGVQRSLMSKVEKINSQSSEVDESYSETSEQSSASSVTSSIKHSTYLSKEENLGTTSNLKVSLPIASRNQGFAASSGDEDKIKGLNIGEAYAPVNDLKPHTYASISLLKPQLTQNFQDGSILRKVNGGKLRPMSINLMTSFNAALAPSGNVSTKVPMGTMTSVGVELTKHYPNWSFSLGGNFSHRTGLNHELLLVKSTYGARLYREYQSVVYKSIGSFGVPIGVNFHRKRNVFGVRLTPEWNMMVNSTYHRYNNYNSDEVLVRNNYGIKEGIRSFDVQLQLMYQRRVTEKLAIGMNITSGFLNQIDQNVISNSNGFRDLSIGMNANYTLFSR